MINLWVGATVPRFMGRPQSKLAVKRLSRPEASLADIPKAHQEKLIELFKMLCNQDTWAFTLFGKTKPMSWGSLSQYRYNRHRKKAEKEDLRQTHWALWQRYAPRFPLKDFFIAPVGFSRVHGLVLSKRNADSYFLIHKPKALKAIQQHWDLFKKAVGPGILPDQVVERLGGNNAVSRAVFNDEALLGILLGFGRTNALLFKRRDELMDWQREQEIPVKGGGYLLRRVAKVDAKPSGRFKTAQNELDAIEKKFGNRNRVWGIGVPSDNRKPELPSFCFDKDHLETRRLMRAYRQEQRELEPVMKSRHFLAFVLQRLAGKPSPMTGGKCE